jgi:hypothetical protein
MAVAAERRCAAAPLRLPMIPGRLWRGADFIPGERPRAHQGDQGERGVGPARPLPCRRAARTTCGRDSRDRGLAS